MISYKDYNAKITFYEESHLYYGTVIGIDDVITFQSDKEENLQKEFENSVDDYLQFCKEEGKTPEKPFADEIKIKASPEFYKKVYLKALENGKSVNDFVYGIIEKSL